MARTKMHKTHRNAAAHYELAANAHRTAAEHNGSGDFTAAALHAQRAQEQSNHAYGLAMETRKKSGEMETL